MESLVIKGTKYTFEIDFNADTGILKMEGSSYPENALEFFQPLYDWLTRILSQGDRTVQLDLKIVYLNTSSSKCILDFLELLNDYHREKGKVKINWYYEEDDEDIMETGEEFFEELECPCELIAYRE